MVGPSQGETCVSMTSNTLLSMSLNFAIISPLNDMNFRFLCRKMAVLKAIFGSDGCKVFDFSLAGISSNATGNSS